MGYLRPNFPKMTSSSEKSSENLRKGSEKRGQGKEEKKAGRGGWGKARKKREGWVGRGMTSSKKIKNKKIKNEKIKK